MLKLHRSIYPKRAVTATVEAFANLADARVSRDGDYHAVQLTLKDPDLTPDELRHEFANYALGQSAGGR